MYRRPASPILLFAAFIALASCGGDDAGAPATSAGAPVTTAAAGAGDAVTDLEETIDELTENLQETQDAEGGGMATLTVGDQSWTFASVLCAFGEDEIGQEGAEFVLSSIQDGLQLYVSVDSFGHSVSIVDISDFENPSVFLSMDSTTASLTGLPQEFVEVDGKQVRSGTGFVDETGDGLDVMDGTLDATCP